MEALKSVTEKRVVCHQTNSGPLMAGLKKWFHTAELNAVNPFDFLVALLRNHDDVKLHPGCWMPWNFGETLAEL